MPVFQASLTDPSSGASAITIDADCGTVTVTDSSNYALSDESGYEQEDFTTFRQLVFTFPNGETYGFDAQGNLDSPWTPPWDGAALNPMTAALALPATAVDGAYCVTLYVVPNYNNATDYTHTTASPSAVFYADAVTSTELLYATIANPPTAGILPTDTDYWEVIEKEDLSAKFKVTECFALTCRELFQCYEKLVHEANCVVTEDLCDDDELCKNKTFLAAMKLRMLLDGISYAAQENDWEAVQILTNAAKKTCSC